MTAVAFLHDLTVVLLAAAAGLLVFRRLGQPPVLGYIAAGALAGPLVTDAATIEALSEVGVVFLLFALGVEFNLKRLAAVGARALVAAAVEVLAVFFFARLAGAALGLSALGSLLVAAVCALASTAIVARSLLSRAGGGGWMELASGVLIAEDILAVAMLAFFASAASFSGDAVSSVARELARLGMLATVVLVAGLLILPRIMRLVERSGMKEVRTLVIVGTCFALSLLTSSLGFSSALGAFLAGAMMSETAAATRLREVAEPFKDVFGSIFFVSVGLLLDGAWLRENWQGAALFCLAVAAARAAANGLAFAAVGSDPVSSVRSAAARLPIGEFSFILARLGDEKGMTPFPLFPLTVAACVATTFFSGVLNDAFHEAPERAERLVPGAVKRLLEEYGGALRRLQVPRQAELVFNLVKPSLIQIALNLLGLSGVFLAADSLKERVAFEATLPGTVWGVTALVTLPFLMALWRKSQAVALILLEALTSGGGDDRPPAEARPGLTRIILSAATVLVAWWYLSLSLPLLPPGPAALAPVAVIFLAGILLWRAANKLYARMQAALRETLARADAEPGAGLAIVSHLVEEGGEVKVATLRLSDKAKGLGASLGELDLRAKTGASILQINRGGHARVSPSAQTRLKSADEVILVGTVEQLAQARELIG
ncbi:MAG: cation:proton antiporter [Elusimicrobia bacterium]|nr:cation:proton antiporter [Elusimicrobiota bacterium]